MPNIKPISDLKNYTEVLNQVYASSRVYLTRAGHCKYGILTLAEIDEFDSCRAFLCKSIKNCKLLIVIPYISCYHNSKHIFLLNIFIIYVSKSIFRKSMLLFTFLYLNK